MLLFGWVCPLVRADRVLDFSDHHNYRLALLVLPLRVRRIQRELIRRHYERTVDEFFHLPGGLLRMIRSLTRSLSFSMSRAVH